MRVLGPVIALLGVLALTGAEHLRWPAERAWQDVAAAVAVMAVATMAGWLIGKVTWRAVPLLAVAAVSGGAAVFLLRRPGQWQFDSGLLLATLALAVLAAYGTGVALRVVPRVRGTRWRRAHAETAVLCDLLDLLGSFAVIPDRRDVGRRRQWLADLERIAVAMERHIPRVLLSGDPQSQAAIVAHAQGVAGFLRTLKRSVALPDDASWDTVTGQVQALVATLALGDLAALPVRQPAAAAPRRARPWW